MLFRRIILGIILLVVAGLVYVGFKSWTARRAMMGGDVYSDTVDSVTTTLKQAAAPSSASTPSQPATTPSQPTTTPSQPTSQNVNSPLAAVATALGASPQAAAAQGSQPANPAAYQAGTQPSLISNSNAPSDAADSIRPNPPNGNVYAGTGHFQVYRQGNLTWRLNTDTGQACVLFATEQEWRRPQVYRNGCASRLGR